MARLDSVGCCGGVGSPFHGLPFGVVAGTAAALFGLAFGVLAVLADPAARWRKAAFVGIGASCLALLIALAEILYVVLVE